MEQSGKLAELSDALLKALAVERAQCAGQRRAAVDDVIASITVLKLYLDEPSESVRMPQVATPAPDTQPHAGERVDKSPYFGMGIGEASVECLRLMDRDMTPRDIWPILSEGGVETAHKEPSHTVRACLTRRANRKGDVMLVGKGRWGLTKWYTEEEKALIEKRLGGMPARDSDEHSENTKRGMELAKKRGARIGARKKLDAKKVSRIVSLRKGGATIKEACAAVGISPATYNNNKEEIALWQEGDPWPLPKERWQEQEEPNVRLVSSKE